MVFPACKQSIVKGSIHIFGSVWKQCMNDIFHLSDQARLVYLPLQRKLQTKTGKMITIPNEGGSWVNKIGRWRMTRFDEHSVYCFNIIHFRLHLTGCKTHKSQTYFHISEYGISNGAFHVACDGMANFLNSNLCNLNTNWVYSTKHIKCQQLHFISFIQNRPNSYSNYTGSNSKQACKISRYFA